MARQQRRSVSPPNPADKEKLQDFSSVVQDNFKDLYEDAHRHDVRTAAPLTTEGQVGDIVPVSLSGVFYLYTKVASDTWKRVELA